MNATQHTSAPSYSALHVCSLLNCALPQGKIRQYPARPKPLPGFVTFFDPGWRILRLRAIVTNREAIFCLQAWYDGKAFAKRNALPRYRQLRMTPVPDSLNKTFAEQQALLPADEEVPSARVVVMGMVIHFLVTGDRLSPNCWVRCIDKDSDGYRVDVGYLLGGGLRVGYYWDDDRYSDLGLASSRKF
jgi:hypothetical protein